MRLVVNLVLPIYHVVCVRLVSSYRETFAYCPYDTFLERGESYDAPSDSGLWALSPALSALTFRFLPGVNKTPKP